MSKRAAQLAFREAGITPDDVQVVELHDCFSANELITYEALGLCPVGKDIVKSLLFIYRNRESSGQCGSSEYYRIIHVYRGCS